MKMTRVTGGPWGRYWGPKSKLGTQMNCANVRQRNLDGGKRGGPDKKKLNDAGRNAGRSTRKAA